MGCGMTQLHKLHRPFDIGQSTLAELEMAFTANASRQPFGLHTRFELADLPQLGFGQIGLRIAQRVGYVMQEILGQALIAGGIPCSQQRLMLPRTRPGTIVFLT